MKKLLYKMARKHFFSIVVMFFLGLGFLENINGDFQFWSSDFIENIIINVISGWIAAVSIYICYMIEWYVRNICEDETKLTSDYDGLVKKYSRNHKQFVSYQYKASKPDKKKAQDDSAVVFPVIRLGNISQVPLKEENIEIEDNKDIMYEVPSLIDSKYEELMSAHDTSTIYNQICIRATKLLCEKDKFFMSSERTTYFNSLVTNRAIDYKWSKTGMCVRELYESDREISPLDKSKLSNHIGFNGFVESEDGYIVFVKRFGNMSIAKRTLGDSIGASLKTKYALSEDGNLTNTGFIKAIYNEIKNELKLEKEDIKSDESYIIAAYRDCLEGGKPQFLIYVKSKKTALQIQANFDKIIKKEKRGKIKNKIPLTNTDGKKLVWIQKEDLAAARDNGKIKAGAIDIYVCKVLGNKASKNGNLPKAREKKEKKFNMVPSASASIIMLLEYLEKKE